MRCYFKYEEVDDKGERVQCEKIQDDCWCSDEHREAWQKENYKEKPLSNFEKFIKRKHNP